MLRTRGVPDIPRAERGRLVKALGGSTGSGLGAVPLKGVRGNVFRVKEQSAGGLRPNSGGTTDFVRPEPKGSGRFLSSRAHWNKQIQIGSKGETGNERTVQGLRTPGGGRPHL